MKLFKLGRMSKGDLLATTFIVALGAYPLYADILPTQRFGIGSTIGGMPILPHEPNNAAIATLSPLSGRFRRDGFATPGDGGEADYTSTATACTLNSGAGDGGSQIGLGAPGAWIGCANIDWASVGFQASPMLFENVLTSADDSAAIRAAVATGRTVYIPDITTLANRNWYVYSDIPQSTPEQLIHGDGRERSQIVINSNAGFSKGVFSLSGIAGPTLRDLGFIFAQSVTATQLSQVFQYVPAIYSVNVPNTHVEHVSAYPCWDCFYMVGNAGQSSFEDLHFTAFHCGITLDGALDSVRIDNPHFFPYGLPNGLYTLYMMFPTQSGAPMQHGLCLGRVDDFKMKGGLFIGGTAMDVHKSTYNPFDGTPLSGQVTNTQFDVYPALTLSYGTLSFSDITATTDTDGTHKLISFSNTGGTLYISGGSHLQVNSSGTATSSAVGGGVVSAQAGITYVESNFFDMGSSDAPYIVQTGGHLTVSLNEFNRNAGITYPNNPIINLQAGDTVAIGNHASTLGSGGSGRFFAIANDNGANRIGWNVGPGYPAYQPSSPAGIYGSNY